MADEFKRIGKGGKEVWIQASYNPILDLNGKPFKVVKYATDISEQKDAEFQIQRLIDLAAKGELDERLDASSYGGSMANLANSFSTMVEAFVGPMRDVSKVVTALAEGDLSTRMAEDYEGEFAVLRDAANGCSENLFDMVKKIRVASTSIMQSSEEISRANTELSQRTEEQASNLEETAATMEELATTVQQNADSASQAEQLSDGSRADAEKGGAVVGSAVDAMDAINDSSTKISDIIGVIDEIAFQTNLLALNAAVEAARAGDQGRGFAVVASEVRNLAQRSSEAAKEIAGLIKDSAARVEEGTKLVNESGETLAEIVQSVTTVGGIISEIATASGQQAASVNQVNSAVTQMDSMTQQNASMVEEASAASVSMSEAARALAELVSFFTLGDDTDSGHAGAQTSVPAA